MKLKDAYGVEHIIRRDEPAFVLPSATLLQ